MRLTLRNLLRFLDQTDLRPVERSRLEQLVEQSEKADAWINRIDQLKRSADVLPPAVDCDQQPLRQVAAYLDCTMGEEDTVEFEQSMLSCDEWLSEVACCHEIREALRSEDRVPIPILLRQSVYDMGRDQNIWNNAASTLALSNMETGDESNSEEIVAALASSMKDLPFVDGRPDDPQPIGGYSEEGEELDDEAVSLDHLSRRAQRRSYVILGILLALLAGLLGLSYELGRRTSNVAENPPDTPSNTELSSTAVPLLDPNSPRDPGTAEEFTDATQPVTDKEPPATENTDAGEDSTALPDFAGVLPIAGDRIDPSVATDWADESLPPRPQIPPLRVFEPPREVLAVATLSEAPSALLKLDATGLTWIRAAAEEAVLEGTPCLVLPGTSAELNFSDKLQVRITGPARFTVSQRDLASGADGLNVQYGFFEVVSQVDDVDLLLTRQNLRYRLTLPVVQAQVSVRFSQYLAPGSDPRQIQPASIDFWVTHTGRATVSEADSVWMLPESTALVSSRSEQPELVREPVTGVVALPVPQPRDYTVRIRETLEKNFQEMPAVLEANQPVADFLVKLKGDLRQERRLAALAWLASLGNYTYLVDFLNDEKNRNNWRSLIESVQASMVNDPAYAEALYESLSYLGEEEQNILFQLLLGYSAEQLETGADRQLVEYLDHRSLYVRVLAIECIRNITGGLAYGYVPQGDLKARRRTISNQWEKVLKKQELRYLEAPRLPLPEFVTPATTDTGEPPLSDPRDSNGAPDGQL